MGKDARDEVSGATPSGSGCQPAASAVPASRSGIPSAIVVEKGIPQPSSGRRGRHLYYPWDTMAVGDSFAIPLAGERWPSMSFDKAAVRVSRAANGWVNRNKSARRFSVRTLADEGVVRCWRVA